jgi:hypothetical protein
MLHFIRFPRGTYRVLVQCCRVPLTRTALYAAHLAHCIHAFKEGTDQGLWWCLNLLLGSVAALELVETLAAIREAWRETCHGHSADTHRDQVP